MDGDGYGHRHSQTQVGQGDQGHGHPLGQVMDGNADGGHNPAPVEPVALGVHLAVHVDMGNEMVEQIDQHQADQEEEIGIAEAQDEPGAAEEVHKSHVDHHSGSKAQAKREVTHVGPGDEIRDQASDSRGQAGEEGQSQGDEDISFHNRLMARIYFNLLPGANEGIESIPRREAARQTTGCGRG